jgi:predicted RNase H-like nuclease
VVRESHPEVVFAGLNDGDALGTSKSEDDGIEARLNVLKGHLDGARSVLETLTDKHIDEVPAWQRRIGAGNRDDLVDAMALAVLGRLTGGTLDTLPNDPPTGAEGRPMEICYAPR